MTIPKPMMIYKCELYNVGDEILLCNREAVNYVQPEHIGYWVGDYEHQKLMISKVWVSPERYDELFS